MERVCKISKILIISEKKKQIIIKEMKNDKQAKMKNTFSKEIY